MREIAMTLIFESDTGVKFFYCDAKKNFNMEDVYYFIDLINAVSFKRVKSKNIHGYWQIFCFNIKTKPCGVILTKSEAIRLKIYKDLTTE